MRLLVSMGVHPQSDPRQPREATLVQLEGTSRREVRFATLGCPGDDQELTGAGYDGARLLQCSRTELLWVEPASMTLQRRLSHPLCYDVHDAIVHEGQLVLSCTGHDSLIWLSDQGELLRHYWLRAPGGDPSGFGDAFGDTTDWRVRPVAATKPHRHHPNQLFTLRGQLWVTLFEDRVARSVDGTERIELPEGPPHDGREREGLHWFTTVTGHVIAVDPKTLQRVVHLDLNQLLGEERLLGWCRAIEVQGDTLYVGFTMLRSGRHRELLRRMVRGRRGEKLPTRVVALDWRRGVVLGEVTLGNDAGGTIYAINALRT